MTAETTPKAHALLTRAGYVPAGTGYVFAAEVEPELRHYCQNPCCGTYTTPRPPAARTQILYSGTGRPPKFCSNACRQAEYRAEKEIRERTAEREREAARTRNRYETMIRLVLIELDGVKMPTPLRKSVAQRIVDKLIQQRFDS